MLVTPEYQKLLDQINWTMSCTRPLVFASTFTESPDEECYGVGGTGFLVEFNHVWYFITAGHCVDTDSADSIRIIAGKGCNLALPVLSLHGAKRDGIEDWYYTDIVAFRINMNEMTEELGGYFHPFHIGPAP
jgi:hypothetical protein